MEVGGWSSPLGAKLYIIGRKGYVKSEEDEVNWRERSKPLVEPSSTIPPENVPVISKALEDMVSRVQLLVQPYKDRIEIVDVGLNPTHITPYEEWVKKRAEREAEKEKAGRLWILPILLAFAISSFYIFKPQATSAFTLTNFSPFNLVLSVIFILLVIVLYRKFR